MSDRTAEKPNGTARLRTLLRETVETGLSPRSVRLGRKLMADAAAIAEKLESEGGGSLVGAVEHYMLAAQVAVRVGAPDKAKAYRDAAVNRIGYGRALYEKALAAASEIMDDAKVDPVITVSMAPVGVGISIEFDTAQLINALKKRAAESGNGTSAPKPLPQSGSTITEGGREAVLQHDTGKLREFLKGFLSDGGHIGIRKLEHAVMNDAAAIAKRLEDEGGTNLIGAVEHYILASEMALRLGRDGDAKDYAGRAKDGIGYTRALKEKAVAIAKEIGSSGAVGAQITLSMQPMGVGIAVTIVVGNPVEPQPYVPGAEKGTAGNS